ncbi:MAG: hypothetical protein RLY77_1320 [Pseudomonadota bacterium]
MLQCSSIFIMPGYFDFLLIPVASRFPAGLRAGAPGVAHPLKMKTTDCPSRIPKQIRGRVRTRCETPDDPHRTLPHTSRATKKPLKIRGLSILERVMGIEPTLAAWEAAVLPLNYTREAGQSKTLPIKDAMRA